MNELFLTEGLTDKQYVDVARMKAARVSKRKDFALTKAEKACVNEIERDLAKWEKRMKFLEVIFEEPVEVSVEPAVTLESVEATTPAPPPKKANTARPGAKGSK